MISHVTQFMDLNDKEFLARPSPQKNELLSSWLVRIARLHDTKTTSFTNMHFKEYPKNIIWQRDLDIWCPETLITRLSQKSHLSKEQIFKMTLRSYEGKLREHIHGKTRTHFIQSLGNYCHIKRNGGLRFCPECLKEDKIPYFRKEWRLSFYTACTKHQCFLHNRCPTCNSPLTISKSYNENDFTFCYKCGTDLKQIKTYGINELSYGLKAINSLLGILDSGYGVKLGEKVHSIDFFRFLKQINKMIYLWEKRSNIFKHEILTETINLNKTIEKIAYEDYLTIQEQYLLYSASYFLICTNASFENFIQANKILECYIYKDI